MSGHKEFINEYIATSDPTVQKACNDKLIGLIQENQLTLLGFIQALQIYITSTNDDIRVLTFKLLSEVLSNLQPSKLFPKDIEVLMAFLFSKLTDKPVTKYVMSSLYSLTRMKYYNVEKTDDVLENLTKNYNPKEHPQLIRATTLKIFNHLVVSTPQDSYSNKLAIECFLHISQNEKDPNNLLLIFQILPTISEKLDISEHVQELFDTMFRYYPISFKSSNEAQESQVVSLKDSLNTCLSSNELYAGELFPNLIEKYNAATSSQVKLDILTTISTVSQAFSAKIVSEHFLSLWNTLKYTIINQELAQLVSIPAVLSYYEESSNESDQIFHSALISIKAISSKLGFDDKLLIFDDLSKNLVLSERNRRFLQSFLTLAIISLPSKSNLENTEDGIDREDEILNRTLTTLFSDEQPAEDIRNKRLLLVALSYFTDNSKFLTQLVPFRDDILMLLQTSLESSEMETTLRTLAIQLTVNLILSPYILDKNTGSESGLLDEEMPILVSKLGELLVSNALKDTIDMNTIIEKELLEALAKVAKRPKCENEVVNVVNGLLMVLNDVGISTSKKCKILDYLIKLAQTQSLVQIIAIRLSNLLPVEGFDNTQGNLPVELVLQALTSLFVSLPIAYNTQTVTKKFLPNLLHFILKQGNEINEIHLHFVCQILRRFIVGLENSNAFSLMLELFNMFCGVLQMEAVHIDDGEAYLLELGEQSYSISLVHLPMLFAVAQGIDLDVDVKAKVDVHTVIDTIVNKLSGDVKSTSQFTQLQIFVGCGIIFNKYLNWDNFVQIFGETNTGKKVSEISIWCLYGLIIKNDSMATKEFVSIIGELDFQKATKAINIIFSPIEECAGVADIAVLNGESNASGGNINLKNGLDIKTALIVSYKKQKSDVLMLRKLNKLSSSNLHLRNMWKQRILEIILQKSASDTYLDYTLPLILTFLPEELYKSHLSSLLPGLINTIESCKSNQIAISILTIICNVIVEPNSRNMIKPYIETIIQLCLRFIDENANKDAEFIVSKELTRQSLKCLLGMSLFDLPSVVPFKREVIKTSERVLEHKSRPVRMLAVSVRQAWEDLGVDLSM